LNVLTTSGLFSIYKFTGNGAFIVYITIILFGVSMVLGFIDVISDEDKNKWNYVLDIRGKIYLGLIFFVIFEVFFFIALYCFYACSTPYLYLNLG
jgi:hypothetical protein